MQRSWTMRRELPKWFIISTWLVSAAAAAGSYTTVVVDKSDAGGFGSVQAAVDSIPTNNDRWICIYIKSGIYTEQVRIPPTKPFILLQGEGMTNTQIVWDGHNDIKNPTFLSSADNLVAMNIGFVNSYNYPAEGNKNPKVPAVAAMIEGDKSAFYGCGFFGLQDTLWDVKGRHYYLGCTMVGAVDFIFGASSSFFEQCVLSVAPLPPGFKGFITAQGKESAAEQSGFVFKNCAVNGGPALLGRAWGPFATVVFYRTTFSNAIDPVGWSSWNFSGHEDRLVFAEAECGGEGGSTVGRVPWEKKLSPESTARYISLDFIQADTWMTDQPKPSQPTQPPPLERPPPAWYAFAYSGAAPLRLTLISWLSLSFFNNYFAHLNL